MCPCASPYALQAYGGVLPCTTEVLQLSSSGAACSSCDGRPRQQQTLVCAHVHHLMHCRLRVEYHPTPQESCSTAALELRAAPALAPMQQRRLVHAHRLQKMRYQGRILPDITGHPKPSSSKAACSYGAWWPQLLSLCMSLCEKCHTHSLQRYQPAYRHARSHPIRKCLWGLRSAKAHTIMSSTHTTQLTSSKAASRHTVSQCWSRSRQST